MNKENQDICLRESDYLKNSFDKIGQDIHNKLNNRIINYNNSILYKHYANVFYFVPKHGLVRVDDGKHNGYLITADHQFFIHDKKKDNTLKFTPKIETVIVPVDKISTNHINKYLSIELDLKNDLEYDNLTFWIDPEFTRKNSTQAYSILNKILNSDRSSMFSEVYFDDNSKSIKEIEVSKLKFQLKSIETDVLKIHSPHMSCGFNVNIKNLFDYNNKKIIKIKIFFETNIIDDITVDLQSLIQVNLVPIFNSYNDYSYTINADLHISEINLKHNQNNHASPISILSIHENNDKIEFDSFFFKGQNDYYFNCMSQTLNYNSILPNLTSKVENIRVYVYACWTDTIDLSDFITVKSNDLSSMKCSVTLIVAISPEKTNYTKPLDTIFSLTEKLHSGSILPKSLIDNVLTILQVEDDTIQLVIDQIKSIQLNKVDNILYVTLMPKFSKRNYTLLEFMISIICEFANRNSSVYIKKFILS